MLTAVAAKLLVFHVIEGRESTFASWCSTGADCLTSSKLVFFGIHPFLYEFRHRDQGSGEKWSTRCRAWYFGPRLKRHERFGAPGDARTQN